MKRFEIGPTLTCDLDRLVDTRLLVQANSGGGKSWCLRRLLEQTHGHVQHLVIDPEGEFASLRERFDYVLASKHGGDTAADPRSAALLAERLLDLQVSAILDIYELRHHERIRFVRLFLEALVNAPKRLWHPAIVILDEAHVYAPQQGEAESAGAVIDLATRGRKRGFCLVPATQRLSKLHKDVAAECNNKLVGRTSLDVDMKRVADELGFASKDQTHQLRDLKPGEFFAYGPAFNRSGISRVVVGAVATTHPKAGARLAFTAPPPTSKITALLPQLADLPAEAEQKVRTEKDLRAEIADQKRTIARLERDVETAKNAAPAGKPTPVLTDAERALMEALQEDFRAFSEDIAAKADGMQAALADRAKAAIDDALTAWTDHIDRRRELFAKRLEGARVQRLLDKIGQVSKAGDFITTDRHAAPRNTPTTKGPVAGFTGAAREPRRPPAAGPGDAALPEGERKVLTAAAMYAGGVSKDQLGVLTGYKRSSRDSYVARLAGRGYVETRNGVVVATPAGQAALGDSFEPLPTGPALLEWWRARLPDGERRVLEVLVAKYPDACRREDIDAETGYMRSSRDSYLSRLSARRLVESSGRGEVKASEGLFS